MRPFEMAEPTFHFGYSSSRVEDLDNLKTADQVPFSGGVSGAIHYFHNGNAIYGNDLSRQELFFSMREQHEEQQRSPLDYATFDVTRFDAMSPSLEKCLEEITKDNEARKEKPNPFQLLKDFGSNHTTCAIMEDYGELSTVEIMQIAGERFIRPLSRPIHVSSTHNNAFISALPDETEKNVEFVEILLASAEKIGYQQYDRAIRLLKRCKPFSSKVGHPVQRIVYYFSEALRERIDVKSGKITSEDLKKKQSQFNIVEATKTLNPTFLAYHKHLPFSQIIHFVAVQAILDNVVGARRIHIIDFQIRSGKNWSALMSALKSRSESQCPLELLKITAIGTSCVQQAIEDTGKRLTSFAQAINIPFCFKIVNVSDWHDLKKDMFELDGEEAVAVYSEYSLSTLLTLPNTLDSTMRVMKEINPCIMVVVEIEANHNSPAFVNRFIEALFFNSAYFDCLEAGMERNDPNRVSIESKIFGEGIKNMVTTEGEGRMTRNVKIDVWRAFFLRLGIMETELSESSLFQAKLVINNFVAGKHCTLDMNGKSLIIGWKGIPLHSLSSWKFVSQEQ